MPRAARMLVALELAHELAHELANAAAARDRWCSAGGGPMARLSLTERARLIGLLADRSRRTATANILASPVLRWRYGPPTADQLLILPQDLRTADPSFWSEISVGHFGLAGTVAFLRDTSPFALKPPSAAWARELHGFGWLRHLAAARNAHAKATAVSIVLDWVGRQKSMSGVAWEPAVIGRRLISWISHANLLLEGGVAESYDGIALSLGEQIVRLSSAWRNAPAGYERLLSLSALVLADLCVADHDRQLDNFEPSFAAEIERQILPDGGHISRNPSLLVEILLDFLPLGQCFVSRGRPVPPALSEAILRMLPMVRFMRLGDGALARFNGTAIPQPDALATVLAYEGRPMSWGTIAPQSRYARLAQGETVVIVDVGKPPPLESAGQAHAGCLSFEMSVGARSLFVNGGAPGPADDDWRAASRATASHTTLCLDGRSSARLVRSRVLEEIVGAPPIRFPERVTASVSVEGVGDAAGDVGGVRLTASHDGYATATRLVHTRILTLAADGRSLDGVDRLGPTHGDLRLKRDVPYAIHFHLHPDVVCTPQPGGTGFVLTCGGRRWVFTATGVAAEVDESVYFSDFSGPRQTRQIVLRGASFGATEVRWSVADTTAGAVTAVTDQRGARAPEATAMAAALPASPVPAVETASGSDGADAVEVTDAAPEIPSVAAMFADLLTDGASGPQAPRSRPPPLPSVPAPVEDFATALARAMETAMEGDPDAPGTRPAPGGRDAGAVRQACVVEDALPAALAAAIAAGEADNGGDGGDDNAEPITGPPPMPTDKA